MLHRKEHPITPRIVLAAEFSINNEPVMNASPRSRNTHHGRVPKWYSPLMTIGWNTPMMRNVATAVISPM
jgi:hypothetical protein